MTMLIRLATLDDAEAVRDIYAPFCGNSPVSFETLAPSVEEMRERIEKTLQILPWIVAEREGLVAGYAYASRHKERAAYVWSVELVGLYPSDREASGVGRILYTSLFASLELQGFYNVLAGVTIPNPGSVGLHEAMGFKPVGVYSGIGYKCGAWHDVVWLQRSLRERILVPAPPLDFETVRGLPGWSAALNAGLSQR